MLAIEREKGEKHRHRSKEKEKEKHVPNGVPGKRKKVDSTLDEDDILALATPAKKERPSPPGPSHVVEKPKIVVPTPKATPAPQKVKKEKPAAEPTTSRSSTVDVPRISIKGKEKEIAPPPAVLPPVKSKKSPAAHVTPLNEKKCRDLLKTLQKLPEAAIFAQPVDPVLDGCPT